MTEERRRVLDLLAQQKISVEEAEQLLAAIDVARPEQATKSDESRPKAKYLRIAIHKKAADWSDWGKGWNPGAGPDWKSAAGRDKDVNIRVPMSIVRSGIRLGAMIPGLAGDRMKAHLRERGLDVDLSKLDPAMIESMLDELGEVNIDVDSGRAQVRIPAE